MLLKAQTQELVFSQINTGKTVLEKTVLEKSITLYGTAENIYKSRFKLR